VTGLPYRWIPLGAVFRDPFIGDLLPMSHQVWRVVEIAPIPEVDWTPEDYRRHHHPAGASDRALPRYVVLRPADLGDDRRRDRHFKLGGDASSYRWRVYPDEHYPVCASCTEPLPCREQMAERTAAIAVDRMSRYETAGVCPACGEVVTSRQRQHTWPDNIEVLGGPPVTFHDRRECHDGAVAYKKRWCAADPERRRTTLSCTGAVTTHGDGTYECTQLDACPGPGAAHPSYAVCDCPDCRTTGGFSCHPAPGARLVLPRSGADRAPPGSTARM
jgi:hypothetical protein